MDFIEVLRSRRSVRKFTERPVPQEMVNEIISAAVLAPSACNAQSWHFIIIDDSELKKIICDNGGSAVIASAPVVILGLYLNGTRNLEYADHVQSASAAIQNMLLAAQNFGLSGCWICHLPAKRVLRRLLDIPGYYEPIAAVVLGYPQLSPVDVARKYQLSEITSRNGFKRSGSIKLEKLLMIKRMLIAVYKYSPVFVKKLFFNKFLDKNFIRMFEN